MNGESTFKEADPAPSIPAKLFRSPSDPDADKYFSDFIRPELLETLEVRRCEGIFPAAIAMLL